ncbi:hypothetical protein Tcan_07970 [Toxocara canis]|uniref:Uncharacterized protein n=1 Tax=Toxocara canis TaxID=6265 RepID=A0A0B2VBX4_TOXCA|nr:hypothetical protein Tcan_07970 [Toxocara canis]
MADAYESWSGFADENDHFRGRSLLKRKQEQWAKERAFPESWFPFGRPGGGAPNEKRATIRSQASGSKTMSPDLQLRADVFPSDDIN